MNQSRRADEENLATYLSEISRIPLMDRGEEERCARDAASGNEAAKTKLVQSNLRFVVTVARQYRGSGLSLSDLIGEGNIGLMAAAERYDVAKGTHFISYAAWWIRQAIRKAISDKGRMIRLPSARSAQLRRIVHACDELGAASLPPGALDRVAGELHLSIARARDLLALRGEPVSLDAPAGGEPDSPSLAETLADTARPLPEESMLHEALCREVQAMLGMLSKREADILRYRCGLGGGHPMSLQEVGARFSLTKERIRQIEKRALRKLRHRHEVERLVAYVG
jgi:RNA polymerase primary sigma factor